MGYLFSLSKSAATIGFEVSEWMLLIFGGVLVLGIFGEYKKLPKRLLLLWPSTVFEILVMVGVAGELLGDGGVFTFSSHLQSIEDKELSALGSNAEQLEVRLKTVGAKAMQAESTASAASTESSEAVITSGNALTLARGARQEADTFEKRLGGAEHKADAAESHVSEALQRVIATTAELARITAPRSLANRVALIKSLESFKGTEFSFGSVFGDDESFTFLKDIDRALTEAGWKRIKQKTIRLGVPALTITGKDDLVELGTNTGVRIDVESTESVETLQSLSSDKLPLHIKVAVVLNSLFFAHISPSEVLAPEARVNVVNGSSKVIRVKVGKKP